MNISKPRKQSLNPITDLKTKRRRTLGTQNVFRHRNNFEAKSNLYQLGDVRNRIIQQLSDIFIPEEDFKILTSSIPPAASNNYLNLWGKFVGLITEYFTGPIDVRCLAYINEQINQCKSHINDIYSKISADHNKQINKKISTMYTKVIRDLDNLSSVLKSPGNGHFTKISESTYSFDRLSNSLTSNYAPLFQCAAKDQTSMNNLLRNTLKPIQNAIRCTQNISKLSELQENFMRRLDNTTESLEKILANQQQTAKNVTSNSPEKKPQKTKHRNSSIYMQPGDKLVNQDKTTFQSQPEFGKRTQANHMNNKEKNTSNDHDDDFYPISKMKLSDSEGETIVPQKPKKTDYKISQSRYEQLNKKYYEKKNVNNNINNNNFNRNMNNNGSSNSSNNLNDNDNNSNNSKVSPRKFLSKSSITQIKSSPNSGSQLYSKRCEETKLLKTLDTLSHKNDKLKDQHKNLKSQMNIKSPRSAEIDLLQKEINQLSLNLEKTHHSYNDMMIDVEMMRDAVDIYSSNIQSINEECEQALRVNRGIEAEDETANFDNPELKRSCESLRSKFDRVCSQLREYQNANVLIKSQEEIDNLTEDEIKSSLNNVKLNTKMKIREIERLGLIFQQLCNLPNPITQKQASSYLKKRKEIDSRKLKQNIETLEDNIESIRKSSNYSPLKQLYCSMKSSISLMSDEMGGLQTKNNELIDKIQKESLKSNDTLARRKNFDVYEQLKEQSRELLIKYFAVQKQRTDQLDTQSKYQIDMQLDDIQEQYTIVMMEIDRIGDNKVQEKLHEKRKIKIRGRKDVAKLLDCLYSAAKQNVEAERKVAALEKSNMLNFKADANVNEKNNSNNLNGEESVAELTESIIECRKVDEIVAVIDEKSNQLLSMILDSEQKGGLKELFQTVKTSLEKGGREIQTKKRIYNLRKEIESYSSCK